MVNFGNVLTAPYKLAGAAPKLVFNLITGKTECGDLIPCGKKNNTTSSDSVTEDTSSSSGGFMSNPLGGMFGGGDGKKTKFLDYQWNDLPGNARTAATTLGYSESNWAKAWAPAEDKWWEDLNATEKEAAENLGWDMNAWDNHYEECNWSQLPQHVQDAASKLGFTSEMWDNDEWPSSTDKWWSEIPAENRKALNTLGYSKYDWE